MKKTQTKTKQRSSGKAIGALVLGAIMLGGGVAVGFGWGTDWTYKRPPIEANQSSEINNSTGSVQLSEGENVSAKFKVRALNASEYWEYEIDAQKVESAYSATVTLANHDDATDKSITLTAEFDDGSSASEYISFSSTAVQSGEEFTFSCIKAFGQPITIKAIANGVESGAKPQCSIRADYVRRFKAIYMTGGEVYNDLTGGELIKNMRFASDGNCKGEMRIDNIELPAAIFIKTDFNSVNDTSIGTITEGVKNVKISYTEAGHGADSIHWETEKAETNNLGELTVSDPSHLFYYYDDDSDTMQALNDIRQFALSKYVSYSDALSKYNKKEASLVIGVQFEGELTGIVYEFYCDVVINPAGMYKPAQNPSFNIGNVIF